MGSWIHCLPLCCLPGLAIYTGNTVVEGSRFVIGDSSGSEECWTQMPRVSLASGQPINRINWRHEAILDIHGVILYQSSVVRVACFRWCHAFFHAIPLPARSLLNISHRTIPYTFFLRAIATRDLKLEQVKYSPLLPLSKWIIIHRQASNNRIRIVYPQTRVKRALYDITSDHHNYYLAHNQKPSIRTNWLPSRSNTPVESE